MKKISRKQFIKTAGLGLIGGPFIFNGVSKLAAANPVPYDCVLVPAQTGGPFYIDPEFERSDIRESLPGLPMKLKIKVMGVKNCLPIPNAVVNIWHCNQEGVYSTFGKVYNNPKDASKETWLRGYQMTNAQGECEFLTNFPGWYIGRATHIHFDIHLGFLPGGPINGRADKTSTFKSQMYVPDDLRAKVYNDIESYTLGDNPKDNADDLILNGASGLLLDFDESDYPNSLEATFCVAIDREGVPEDTPDPQGKDYFLLAQNTPNPFKSKTEFSFEVFAPGKLSLSIYNSKFELKEQLLDQTFDVGQHTLSFNPDTNRKLRPGVYEFHLVFENDAGRFRQKRKMVVE